MRPTGIVLIAAVLLGVSASGWAQAPMPHDSVHAAKTLFTYRDPLLAAGFAGLTVAMFPIDKSVARRLQNPSVQANRFIENASTDLRLMADPGGAIIGISLYGVGRLARWRNVADFGLHVTEALSVAGLTTVILRGVAGRSRPFVVGDSTPRDFRFGRGFDNHDFQSFPSGHATSAFALASTVTSESQRWWPHQTWIVGPLVYGAAALSGFGRMYNDRHWASDIVSGAAIGTFAGIKVVRYSHGHPSNMIDRFFLGSMVAAGSHGDVKFGFSFPN
jgi:membrane-associated phospholipid phosphatase